MRIAVVCLTAAALAACSKGGGERSAAPDSAPHPPRLGPGGRPHLKPGFWRIQMESETAFGATMTGQLCVDPRTESSGFKLAPGMKSALCSEPKFGLAPSGVTFDVTCRTHKGRTVATRGTASGDFGKAYRLEATSTFDPPLPASIGTVRSTVEASWLGPCPEGSRPGQMSMKFRGLGQG